MLRGMLLLLAEGILGLSEGKIALLISGIAIVFAVKRWRKLTVKNRSRAESAGVDEGRRAGTGNSLNVREVATELSALLAELEETARRVAAQMDNRRTGLEVLLKEADEKIKRLEGLVRAAPEQRGEQRTEGRVPVKAERSPERVVERAVENRSAGNVGGGGATSGAAHDAAVTLNRLRAERGAPVASEDPAYRPIYQLADLGKSAREIAQELGRQPGEVELILALRGRQRVG
jgi:hypothetical protein